MQVIIDNFTIAGTSQPPNTVAGNFYFRMMKDGLPHDSKLVPAPLPPSVTMNVGEYGTYTLEVSRLNVQGSQIGAVWTKSVPVLAPPPVIVEMVTGATVTVV